MSSILCCDLDVFVPCIFACHDESVKSPSQVSGTASCWCMEGKLASKGKLSPCMTNSGLPEVLISTACTSIDMTPNSSLLVQTLLSGQIQQAEHISQMQMMGLLDLGVTI